ncbi:type 1 glutamine amidotransferase domain-containing protein [Agromyces sp. Marseille-Q5079]|uniref:type 1 glutamine amidotransferase domain-containing protein n=1 Tax=Agromyces sp. Marseille-Q5079 TaxID=3439059 RepID=UPI003D9C9B6D
MSSLLTEAGIEVVVASAGGGEPPVDPLSFGEGVEDSRTETFEVDDVAMALFRDSHALTTLASDAFDGLFFAGGHGGMWDLPDSPTVATLIASTLDAGKSLAAVCHGVAALCGRHPHTGRPFVEGRRVTALRTSEEIDLGREEVVPFLLQERLVWLGAEFDEAPVFTPHVVTDGSLITGQNMRSADHASRSFLAELASRS